MNDAMSVPFGAAIAVVLALFVILIDWERIRARLRRLRKPRPVRYAPIPTSAADMLIAEGWPASFVDVMSNGPYEVTTTVYRNGNARVWLKRAIDDEFAA